MMTPQARRALLTKYGLVRIELTLLQSGVYATAYPDSFHPEVVRRREEGMAGAADEGGGLTLAQAGAISQNAFTQPLDRARGDTEDEALANLIARLKAGAS